MKTIDQRRIGFLTDHRSDIWIARETGIPRATVGFVRRGERQLPAQYTASLRNAFQREAYGRMREIGFSSHQAKRFSWYAPESIRIRIADMKLTVNKLTLGVSAQKERKLRKEGIPYDEVELWADTWDDIVEGLQRSKKTIEDIGEY